MTDPIFADPRLARVYDDLDGDRIDLDHYVAIVDELRASTVLDIGCGTGTLACRLARRGLSVIGLDPAAASLDVARAKPGAHSVRWILGDATDAPPSTADLATMTGNVAQVFVSDESWAASLAAVREALVRDGQLVFEARDPADRAWERWTREQTTSVRDTRAGPVESFVEVTSLDLPRVSFRWTFRLMTDDVVITSHSTLRFRALDELDDSLDRAGFEIVDVRDAPDRPGRELVVIARRLPDGASVRR